MPYSGRDGAEWQRFSPGSTRARFFSACYRPASRVLLAARFVRTIVRLSSKCARSRAWSYLAPTTLCVPGNLVRRRRKGNPGRFGEQPVASCMENFTIRSGMRQNGIAARSATAAWIETGQKGNRDGLMGGAFSRTCRKAGVRLVRQASRLRPFSHSTSLPPACRFSTRASTKNKSDSRFTYWRGCGFSVSVLPTPTMLRSARRQTVLQT
jgi:hypothetical protein